MNSGPGLLLMIPAQLVVMALGFLKIISIKVIVVLLIAMFSVQIIINIIRLFTSKKVKIIKQHGEIIKIEPIGNNKILAKVYSHLYIIESLAFGVLLGCIIVIFPKILSHAT